MTSGGQNNKQINKQINQVLVHDINASISALFGAVEVIRDEWKKNPELVDLIIPLTLDKIHQLEYQLKIFRVEKQ